MRAVGIMVNVRFKLPHQPLDATHPLNLSARVSNSNVLRGRKRGFRATFSLFLTLQNKTTGIKIPVVMRMA